MKLSPKLLTVALAALMLVPASAPAATAKKTQDVSVMTRNLYLGADIITLATASSREDFEQKAGALFQRVQQTDFPARAPLIADEIRRTKPDLIGLQEVALWRRGADGVKDGSATPATTVVYDWLENLQDELDKRGLKYKVLKVQDELDVEGPTNLGYDIRFTQRDAILVRVDRKLKTSKTKSGSYNAGFTVPTQIGEVFVKRGWVKTDVNYNGARFRYANTHLEAYSEAVGLQQAKELIGRGGAARSSGQTILTGDMNSERGSEGSDPIDALLGFGFDDTFFRKTRRNTVTCCQQEDLLNTESQLKSRIDFVLAKPRAVVRKSQVVGNNPSVRTPSGLWPSDHAGVVSTLRLPARR